MRTLVGSERVSGSEVCVCVRERESVRGIERERERERGENVRKGGWDGRIDGWRDIHIHIICYITHYSTKKEEVYR